MAEGRLQGKVALITGIGGGQGRAAALLFAREGAVVAGCDIKADGLAETMSLVRADGGQIFGEVVDLGDEPNAAAWIEHCVAECGDFDILYNNAAACHYGRLAEMPSESWEFIKRNELDLVYYATKHALPALKRRGGGSIINTASVGGVSGTTAGGQIYQFAHSMAKGGIIAMTRTLATDLASDNIRVNAISPGLIMTPQVEALLNQDAVQHLLDNFVQAQPIKRIGQPEDIAYFALYLASDESSFVTGQNFCIDGGLTAA